MTVLDIMLLEARRGSEFDFQSISPELFGMPNIRCLSRATVHGTHVFIAKRFLWKDVGLVWWGTVHYKNKRRRSKQTMSNILLDNHFVGHSPTTVVVLLLEVINYDTCAFSKSHAVFNESGHEESFVSFIPWRLWLIHPPLPPPLHYPEWV